MDTNLQPTLQQPIQYAPIPPQNPIQTSSNQSDPQPIPQRGLSMFTLIGLVFFMSISVGGYWSYRTYNNRHADSTVELLPTISPQKYDTDSLKKGQIVVNFKPETSEQVARSVLEKYNLEIPPYFFLDDGANLGVTHDVNLDKALEQIKSIELVQSARINSNNPNLPQAWVTVKLTKFIKSDEIEPLFKSVNGVSVNQISRFYVFKVDKDKEAYYTDLLGKEPSVKYASIDQVAMPQ